METLVERIKALPRGERTIATRLLRWGGGSKGGLTVLIHRQIRCLPRGHPERRKFGKELINGPLRHLH